MFSVRNYLIIKSDTNSAWIPCLQIAYTLKIQRWYLEFRIQLRLGAQSVTLLSTLRDPTQLRQCQCPTRKQHPFFVPLRCLKPKNSNSYCSSKGRKSFLVGKKVQQGFRGFCTCFWAPKKGVLLSSCPLTLSKLRWIPQSICNVTLWAPNLSSKYFSLAKFKALFLNEL